MICPNCRAEYRRGFTACADCGVALVEQTELVGRRVEDGAGDHQARREHFAGAPGDPNEDPFCSFWKGTDLRVCTEICTLLDEAGIPHKTIRRQDHLFNLNNQSAYEVGVPASLYEKAETAIKEAFGTDEETGEDAVRLLNERNRESFERLANLPLEEKLKERPEEEAPGFLEALLTPKGRQRGLGKVGGTSTASEREGYPEDATSIAWEGEPPEARETIELSLTENDIWTRWEMENGKPRLFVLSEDEGRAKEIVREIVEGQAPG